MEEILMSKNFLENKRYSGLKSELTDIDKEIYFLGSNPSSSLQMVANIIHHLNDYKSVIESEISYREKTGNITW